MPDNYSVAPSSPHAQKVTAASTSDVQTFSAPSGGRAFYISVVNQDVFVTFDGSTPSSANGIAVPKGGLPVFFGISVPSIRVSPTAAVAATVNVLWVSG